MKFQLLINSFIKNLSSFEYDLYCTDKVWRIRFPTHQNKWHYIHINKYKQTYYIDHITDLNRSCDMLEATINQEVRVVPSTGIGKSVLIKNSNCDVIKEWTPIIQNANKWFQVVKRNWVKANKRVQLEFPLKYREGIVPHSIVSESLQDIYKARDNLGTIKTKKFITLVENGHFSSENNYTRKQMCAADYFEYCRIAYLAGQTKKESIDKALSGREMYIKYADGRHGGLLDINEKSEKEFSDWVDGEHKKYSSGGHPYEIRRGGNTTHIDLYVRRQHYNKDNFVVELSGESIGRLVETIKMFLAIHNASLPISIFDPEGIRKRLLYQDNIGIVPCYSYLNRASQNFKKEENVYNVIKYEDLGRFKRRITPFITWKPLSILRPCHN